MNEFHKPDERNQPQEYKLKKKKKKEYKLYESMLFQALLKTRQY